ncbi:YoaK family protein [Planotetraspora mira]|uniref:DUF1275 family protein n=1 Tax=Planotetraspora mira TaxID=58121 RepID=A0A8J3TSH0_9ACTN|nr:YoaK family protein [Planotetraspora mira]GII31496.1 DUF1275 family protein [Planotetraspora mira]
MRASATAANAGWWTRLGPQILATALTFATGATNAISFFGLGGVFTSVMTGNLVLLGLAVGRPDATLAAHATGAIAGFVAGVLAGSHVIGRTGPGHPGWGVRVAVVLGAEFLMLAGLLGVWAAEGGHPTGGMRLTLAGVASLAMGAQSAVVRTFGIPGLSTTFFTGTLTGVVAGLVTEGRVQWHNVVLLTSVAVGAAAGGWMVDHGGPYGPVVPVALLAFVLAGLWPLAVRPGRTAA